MSSMRHEAIYNTHPNVISIDDTLGAFDKDGNSVSIDEVKVSHEIEKLNAKFEFDCWNFDNCQSNSIFNDRIS